MIEKASTIVKSGKAQVGGRWLREVTCGMHVRQEIAIQCERGARVSIIVKVWLVRTILYTVTIHRYGPSAPTPSSSSKHPQTFPKRRLAPILQFMNQNAQHTPNASLMTQHPSPHLFSPPPSNIHRSSCRLATFLRALLFNATLISSSTATGSQCAFSLLSNSMMWFSCSVRHSQHIVLPLTLRSQRVFTYQSPHPPPSSAPNACTCYSAH
jgi:hypothetical protein